MTAIIFLSGISMNTGYAINPPAEKALSMKTMQNFAPVAPVKADFNDMSSEMASDFNLAPITPAMADFEDATDTISLDSAALAPVTPTTADFE